MNKYRKSNQLFKKEENVNLDINSVVMMGPNKYGMFHFIKKQNNALFFPGGNSLMGNIISFSSEEKYKIFRETMLGLFSKNGHTLYDISENQIKYLFDEYLTIEIKDSASKFNAMLESLQETGKLFFKDLELIYYERVGDHEKYFYKGKGYLHFSLDGKRMEPFYEEEDDLDRHPLEGRDFHCQDDDLSSSSVEVSARDLLESFEKDGDLSRRYGRGAHRVALVKLLKQSNFLAEKENKDLIFLLEKVK